MIQLFSADAVTNNTDQSLTYLGNVFGNFYGLFPGAGDETILGVMFEQFNLMILTVGILMVLYVTVVGLMNTAHEGEFMGKRWNNMWVPIRAVLGIATLVPMSGGFCVLQFVMMWAIVQGIAAADVVWHSALSFIAQTGSPFASISLPGTQAQATLNSLFNGIVCEQTTAQKTPNIVPGLDGNDNAYFCYVNPQNAACINPLMDPIAKINFLQAFATILVNPTIQYSMGPDGTCGTLLFSNPNVVCAQQGSDSLQCATSTTQLAALKTAFPIMTTFAQNFMELDKAYQQFFQNSTNGSVSLAAYLPPLPGSLSTGPVATPPSSIGDGALAALLYCQTNNVNPCDYTTLPKPLGDNMNAPNNVVDQVYWPYMQKNGISSGSTNPLASTMAGYTSSLQATVTTYLAGACNSNNPSASSNPNCPQLSGFLGAADSSGWIMAGSYYLILARMNSNNLKSSMPPLSYNIDPKIAATNPSSTINNYRNLYNSADELAYLAAGGSPSSGTNSLNDKASQATSSGVADMNTQMSNQTEPNSMRAAPVDPISQLTGTGYALMLIASIIYAVLLVIFTIIAVLVGIDVLVLGSGITEDPAKEAFWFLMMMMMPLVFMLLGVMVSVGATFGIYIPFIPFTVFMVGAIGWMISTVEAMVAGPLVALGIISPSGQHEVLGKAEPALMLLFGICLRPTLMIFGMFAAMLLSAQVMAFVDAGFYLVYSNMFDFANTGNTPDAGGQAALAANPVASIMILIVYCGTVVTALNKTFSAIYIIPERTMGWISGSGQSHNEGEAAGKLEGSVSSGGSGVTGGYEKGTGGGSGLVSRAGSKNGSGESPASIGPGQKDKKGNVGQGPALPGQDGNHPPKK